MGEHGCARRLGGRGELDQPWSAFYDRGHRGVIHERQLLPGAPSKRGAPKAADVALRLVPESHALLRAPLANTAGRGDSGASKSSL